MTPEERNNPSPEARAEKIAYVVNGDSLYNDDRARFRSMYASSIADVAAQIREAVEEEIRERLATLEYVKVRDAYEDAAKIVESFNLPDGNEFYWYKQQTAAAEAIRARAKELK